ncbi:hypothetical protein [Amphritea sp.]
MLIKLIDKSATVAGVMSLYFCASPNQLSLWVSRYPQAAAVGNGV